VGAIQTARRQIQEIGALRLVNDGLSILAGLKAALSGETLALEGWLPDATSVTGLRALLQSVRPDLQIDITGVHVSDLVRLPEGETLPLRADSPMLQPIVSAMHVPSGLDIARRDGRLIVTGMVPSEELRKEIIAAVASGPHGLPVEADRLRATRFALAAPFTAQEVIIPFLRSFYGTLAPGDFSVHADGKPRLSADATRTLESTWLTLLRPLTKGRRADMKLAYFPSRFHFPGRRLETVLPEDSLQTARDVLAGQYFIFAPGSAVLNAEEQARLASLVPALLTAGPALKLIVGGHPDPAGDLKAEAALSRRRAEQVVSFLIEQGTPAAEIQAVAFDPVPVDSRHAPSQVRSVEILIQ
jgi:hypothetical protein